MDYLKGKILSIDKSNWTSVKFGDVVGEPKKSVKDIANEEIEHVVGLEHIDSENIHLHRFAGIEESTTFTKKFSKGDVLFGRRRAYLKKAALANFSGICSGDITVMRVKDGLMPELLPFIVQNDKFFDYAVKHSAGGLSPRVKFKDLANYEFLLPPKDQQAQLEELLWAMDEVIEKELETLIKLEQSKYVYFNNVIVKGLCCKEMPIKYKSIQYPNSWKAIHLRDLLIDMNNGISETQNSNGEGIKITRIETISDGNINPAKIGYVKTNTDTDYSRHKLNIGDILFSHINSISHIGKVALYDKEYDLYHGVNLMRLKLDSSIVKSKFLHYHLKNKIAKYFFERRAKQAVNQASLDQSDIGSLPLAIPELNIQDKIVARMEIVDKNIIETEFKIHCSKSLQKSLINHIF